MARLAVDFRNRAAHTDSLTKVDYDSCSRLVTGDDGLLWKLVRSTTSA